MCLQFNTRSFFIQIVSLIAFWPQRSNSSLWIEVHASWVDCSFWVLICLLYAEYLVLSSLFLSIVIVFRCQVLCLLSKPYPLAAPSSSKTSLLFTDHPVFSNYLKKFLQVSNLNSTDIYCRPSIPVTTLDIDSKIKPYFLYLQFEENCHEKAMHAFSTLTADPKEQREEPDVHTEFYHLLASCLAKVMQFLWTWLFPQ